MYDCAGVAPTEHNYKEYAFLQKVSLHASRWVDGIEN